MTQINCPALVDGTSHGNTRTKSRPLVIAASTTFVGAMSTGLACALEDDPSFAQTLRYTAVTMLERIEADLNEDKGQLALRAVSLT